VVELETDQPEPEETLQLLTQEKKAVQVSVKLFNPIKKRVTFDVVFDGEGLIGERLFDIEPKQSYEYKF